MAAGTNLASFLASQQSHGVSIRTYPLDITLLSAHRPLNGSIEFTLAGPPGTYEMLVSTNSISWSPSSSLTNDLGSAVFVDTTLPLAPQKFYRARKIP
jgi:hypothetical protein